MPIEDADKVHSRRGSDKAMITIFGKSIGLMKLMTIAGVGFAAIFLLIGGVMMMTPQPVAIIDPNVTAQITQQPTNTTLLSFEMFNTNYNYKIIKMSYGGNKTIVNIQKEILLSIYPPQSPHYVQRQAIDNDNVTEFGTTHKIIYIYTGLDNAFHLSYTIPSYSTCIDFIDGDWILNVDDNSTQRNMYTYKFNITNSKLKIIENGMSINNSLQGSQDYSTFLVYSGLYKERILLTKPTRLVGIGNPTIDAGGSGSGVSIHSNNNVITGFIIFNSGNKDFMDGGISIMPLSNGNIITKNTIYKSIYGIFMYQTESNTITNNTIYENDKNGIMLVNAFSTTITGNNIYNNVNGIHANALSDLNIIRDNNVHDNKDYGILIENYKSLHNTCEYNTYSNNKVLCSDSIDRSTNQTQTQTITPTTTGTINADDWWSDCKGNPKCYQSQN
jgi:parallel beta-helix repeat protein